ncbi:MAG: hypothetical protein MUC65_07535, partial [Pontiellaceae bacterium]|nr:hypothetical protein [Pontiellaceae bacterium]
MNYQLHYQMEEFEEGMDKSLLLQPIVGCIFRKSYYDPIAKRNFSDYITAQDLVVNYTTKATIEEAERKTHVLYHSVNDMRLRAKSGVYDSFVWDLGPGSMTFVNAGS